MPDMFDQYAHQRPDTHPTIYAYTEVGSQYSKYIKVGYTGGDAEARVAQQYPTLRPGPNKPYKILYTESAMRPDGSAFNDHDVHRMLQYKGHLRLKGPDGRPTEWFDCTVNDVKAAVYAVRARSLNLENRTAAFAMRPEQCKAVDKTEAYFRKERANGRIPKFLWNAKMRFGKTFAAYQLAKRLDAKRVLVLTFKPAVESAWEEDLLTHVDFEGWQFYSRKTAELTGLTPEQLDPQRPIVCFGSFQDYLGTNDAGGIKAKNEWVHTTNWDLVIFDEYHFGAWRENAKRLFDQPDDDSYDALDIEKYKKEEADNAYNESFLPITTQYYLYLSGTPFRALNNGEFIEDEIFNWTYSDEQREKANWKGSGPNPYAALPRMVMMTYRIPESIRRIAYNEQFNEFDLNLFFSAGRL